MRTETSTFDLIDINDTCTVHGNFTRKVIRYRGKVLGGRGCPECAAEAERQRIEAERAAQKRDRCAALRARSHLGEHYLNANFDPFNDGETEDERCARLTCQQFAEDFEPRQQRTLWLLGNVGTGKTHLASSIVLDIIERKQLRGVVIPAQEIVRAMRLHWREPGSGRHEQAVLNELATADLLVIDDIGAGCKRDDEKEQLFEVVDARYRNQRPTMLTSNLSDGEVKRFLGDRLYDRLRVGATVVPFAWTSRRGRR